MRAASTACSWVVPTNGTTPPISLPATLGPAQADKVSIKAKGMNEKTAGIRVAQNNDRFSVCQTFAAEGFLAAMAAGSTTDTMRIEPPYAYATRQ